MDPVSLGASIVTILQLSSSIINFLSAISSSTVDIRNLMIEISATRGLLSSLAEVAALDEGWNEKLREMSTKDGPLQMQETLLRKLEESLDPETGLGGRLRQWGRRLNWPFKLEETREMLQVAIDKSQELVSGTVRLNLYKGNVAVVGRESPYSLYDQDLVTFEEGKIAYDHRDASGFIRLNALRLRTLAQRRRKLAGR